jgi:hypothetical protein
VAAQESNAQLVPLIVATVITPTFLVAWRVTGQPHYRQANSPGRPEPTRPAPRIKRIPPVENMHVRRV